MKNTWLYNRDFLRNHAGYFRGDVVDVGCGNGKYRDLVKNLPGVTSYTGIDFYKTKVANIVADLNKPLSVSSNSFNVAICLSVIEHLQEPQLALDEMYRILRPGGYLLLSTPWVYPYHHEPNDYFRFSRYALKYMLEKSGFEVNLILPTGGKFRVFLSFLALWFPSLARIRKFFEQFVRQPEINTSEEEKKYLTTPSHKIIARKPPVG